MNLGTGKKAKAVSTGVTHSCAILDDDSLKCWGGNNKGQLGYGDTTQRTAPEATATVNLGQDRTAVAISTGTEHTCALLDDDTVKCWGAGNIGQLGYGDTTDRTAPEATDTVPLGKDRTAKAIDAHYDTTCVILDDDSVKCWGANDFGQLGGGTQITNYTCNDFSDDGVPCKRIAVAVLLPRGSRAQKIFVRGYRNCAQLVDNSVMCWGRDNTSDPDSTGIINHVPVALEF